MNCGAKVLEVLLRLELDCERPWDGISGTDPTGEKDWCRLCPNVVAEAGKISMTEVGRPEGVC